jgi:hypothetical protein
MTLGIMTRCKMKLSKMRLSITTLTIMTLGKMALSKMTLCIMTLGKTIPNMTLSIFTLDDECHYAECRGTFQ